jgi:membrane fusion protein (multidrug efflux system)
MASESTLDPIPPRHLAGEPDAAHELHRVLSAARGLAACTDLAGAASRAVSAARELTDADRASCWFYDASTAEMWRQGRFGTDAEASASDGLVGHAARTAQTVCVPEAGVDPRYHRATDDPVGRGRERIIAAPVVGPDAEVHAVLVVVRGREAAPFSGVEVQRLRVFAASIGHSIQQLALQLELRAELDSAPPPLFRSEAIAEHARGGDEGSVIRIVPGWVRYAYASIVLFLVASAAALWFGRVHHYSSGPAVIRISGRTEVTANLPGTVESAVVSAGDFVEEGAVLVRLYDGSEDEERLRREFDAALRDRLLLGGEPDDDPVLRSLRSELQAAVTRREQRLVRSPRSAVVGDVRVRPGQAVAPGDIVASLVTDPDELSVLAVLPGADRPMLAPGMSLRLQIQGYPHAYADLTVDAVGDEIVGPAEVKRMLGPVAESLAIPGSAVVVRGRLPSTTFVADDHTYGFHDGMPAIGHVRLRRQRILEVLVPGLDALELAP